MANQFLIKGVFDSKDLEQGIKRTTQLLETSFDEKGRSLFDDETMKMLKGGFQHNLGQAQQFMGKLTQEAKKLDSALKDTNLTETKRNDLLNQRLALHERIVNTQRQLRLLQESGVRAGGAVRAGGTARGQPIGVATSAIGGAAGQLPGIGQAVETGTSIASVMKSTVAGGTAMGLGAILKGTGIGMAAGAALTGAYGVSRAVAGYDTYKQIIPDELKRHALGAEALDYEGMSQNLGFARSQVLSTQIGARRAFGATEDEGARTGALMGFGRATGMESSQLVQMGQTLRQVMGTDRANQELAGLMERSFEKGLDRSQVPHFLEATTSLLTQINQTGVMNTDKMISAVAGMLPGTSMSPERAAKVAGGLQQAVSGSQGEANTFFQLAFAEQGLGGGGLLGTKFAVRQGLLGMDESAFRGQMGGGALTDQFAELFQGMGLMDQGFTQKAATGILERLESTFGEGWEGTAGVAKLGFLDEILGGGRQGEELAQMVSLLEKMRTPEGLTEKEKTTLEELQKDQATRWQDDVKRIMDTTAGHTQATEAHAETIKNSLGENAAGAFSSLIGIQTSMDKGISNIAAMLATHFGIETPEEREEKRLREMRASQSPHHGMGWAGYMQQDNLALPSDKYRDLAGKSPMMPTPEETEPEMSPLVKELIPFLDEIREYTRRTAEADESMAKEEKKVKIPQHIKRPNGN